jgi:p-aminobenzoyl-glutamate transporter AbgT
MLVDEHRDGEAKFADRSGDLGYLFGGMRASIAGVGDELRDRPSLNLIGWPRKFPTLARAHNARALMGNLPCSPILIVPIDPILTEITNDAIHLLKPTHSIDLMANFYFGIVSSLVLIVVCTVITERVVEPRLGAYRGEMPADSGQDVSAEEARGLRLALYALVPSVVVIALLTFPPGARCAIKRPERSSATRPS